MSSSEPPGSPPSSLSDGSGSGGGSGSSSHSGPGLCGIPLVLQKVATAVLLLTHGCTMWCEVNRELTDQRSLVFNYRLLSRYTCEVPFDLTFVFGNDVAIPVFDDDEARKSRSVFEPAPTDPSFSSPPMSPHQGAPRLSPKITPSSPPQPTLSPPSASFSPNGGEPPPLDLGCAIDNTHDGCDPESADRSGAGSDELWPVTLESEAAQHSLVPGRSGAYVARDESGAHGVFKPLAEEARNDDGSPLKRGVTYGESFLKETCAFIIGEPLGVPETRIASTAMNGQSVIGSWQRYVEHDSNAEEVGSSQFSIDEVQRIGILDIRILNLDRHLGNLLVRRPVSGEGSSSPTLVPIDHGYSFPSYRDVSDVYFGWTFWRQARQELTPEMQAFVRDISIERDAQRLRDRGLPRESIVASSLATVLLKHCAAKGMSLKAIAMLVQRSEGEEGEAGHSVFERVLRRLGMDQLGDVRLWESLSSPSSSSSEKNSNLTWLELQRQFLFHLDAELQKS